MKLNYSSHSLSTFTFLFLAFLCSCSEEENNDLPRLPETISGKLDNIDVAFNFGESFREVTFSFKDYNKEPIQFISVELPLKGRPANAELIISNTDIIPLDCSLAFENDANGVPYAVEAKPINSPSITIKFYEGAKVSFFNPNRPDYDPIEELDSPKEINIDANELATASFYPYGVPENHPLMLQLLKHDLFITQFNKGIMTIADADFDTPGLQRVPLHVTMWSYNPYYNN